MSAGNAVRLRGSFDWVFMQLGNDDLGDFPDTGTKGLYEWAEQNQGDFYKLAMQLLSREKQDGTGTIERKTEQHHDKLVAHGTRLLDSILSQGAEGNGEEPETQAGTTEEGRSEQDNPPGPDGNVRGGSAVLGNHIRLGTRT